MWVHNTGLSKKALMQYLFHIYADFDVCVCSEKGKREYNICISGWLKLRAVFHAKPILSNYRRSFKNSIRNLAESDSLHDLQIMIWWVRNVRAENKRFTHNCSAGGWRVTSCAHIIAFAIPLSTVVMQSRELYNLSHLPGSSSALNNSYSVMPNSLTCAAVTVALTIN